MRNSMNIVRILCAFIIAQYYVAALEPDLCDTDQQSMTEIGERLDLGKELSVRTPPLPIFHPKAKYLRALVQLSSDASCDWSLFVRDGHFRSVQVLKKADFIGPRPSRWTERVAGDHLILDLQNCSDASLRFMVLQYIQMPESARNPYYSLQNSAHATYQDLYQSEVKNPDAPKVPESVKRLGDNVAFIMMSYDRKSWVCSGLLLGEGLLLTNHHCGGIDPLTRKEYWRSDIVQDLVADISWDGDAVSREYGGSKYLGGSPILDYALVEVRRLNGNGPVDDIPVAWKDDETDAHLQIDSGRSLFLVHHPAGLTKQLSRCQVTHKQISNTRYAAGSEFGTNCDSEKGSSGGPIFDEAGVLVGIHHAGFALDKDCHPLDRENKAILVARILDDAKMRYPEVYSRFLKRLARR
jgi:hypothetical protein